MSIIFNGTTIPIDTGIIKYNNIEVTKVVYNGTTVWEKISEYDLNSLAENMWICGKKGTGTTTFSVNPFYATAKCTSGTTCTLSVQLTGVNIDFSKYNYLVMVGETKIRKTSSIRLRIYDTQGTDVFLWETDGSAVTITQNQKIDISNINVIGTIEIQIPAYIGGTADYIRLDTFKLTTS